MPSQTPLITTDGPNVSEDALDPRIHVELEKLNKASEDINRLELQLDEARAVFRQVLCDSTQKLNALTKKLGTCIERARPYYEARMKAKEVQLETQNAALRYEKSCSQVVAAKEMVYLAEQGFFKKGQPFDPAWQEMLNHATMKVNDAEKEKFECELEHCRMAHVFSEAEQHVTHLQRDLKRTIAKSRPYFEMKAQVNHQMEEQKKVVSELQDGVVEAKRRYSQTLRNLESISDEIHQHRHDNIQCKEMGVRGTGVGAEAPSPPPHPENHSASETGVLPNLPNDIVAVTKTATPEKFPSSPDLSRKVSVGQELTCPKTDPSLNISQGACAAPLVRASEAVTRDKDVDDEGYLSLPNRRREPAAGQSPTHSPSHSASTPTPHVPNSINARPTTLQPIKSTSSSNQTSSTHTLESEDGGIDISAGGLFELMPKAQSSQRRSIKSHPLAESASSSEDDLLDELLAQHNGPRLEGSSCVGAEVDGSEKSDALPSENVKSMLPTVSSMPLVPVVQLTTPGSEASEVSPAFSPDTTSPDTEPEGPAVIYRRSKSEMAATKATNAAIMASLQRAKSCSATCGLRPRLRARLSQDDLLEVESDSESVSGSLASASMLDDEQVESLMLETGEYLQYMARLETQEATRVKRRSLPSKLAYLDKYVNLPPEWLAHLGAVQSQASVINGDLQKGDEVLAQGEDISPDKVLVNPADEICSYIVNRNSRNTVDDDVFEASGIASVSGAVGDTAADPVRKEAIGDDTVLITKL